MIYRKFDHSEWKYRLTIPDDPYTSLSHLDEVRDLMVAQGDRGIDWDIRYFYDTANYVFARTLLTDDPEFATLLRLKYGI